MPYYYAVPPGAIPPYNYSTSASTSPSPEGVYDYYLPQYRSPGVSPDGRLPRRHHVRTTSYTPPKVATWATPAGYALPRYEYSVPPPSYDYVSADSHKKPRARRSSMSGHGNSSGEYIQPLSDKRHESSRSQKQRIYVDAPGKADDRYHDSKRTEKPRASYAEPRVGRQPSVKKKADNYFFFTQTTTHEADTSTRSRARRNSTNTTNTRSKPATKQPKPPTVKPATAEDARKYGIPANYCLKNWDATEQPVVLLGSVFDANSIGKWIYDWTVYYHQAKSPLAEVAGELWLLLIKFAAKRKRAQQFVARTYEGEDRRGVKEFLSSSDRIWKKFVILIKACEEYMWDKTDSKTKVMTERSGVKFVASIFGRDRQLENTEMLMTNIRTWIMRFDANYDEMLLDFEELLNSKKKSGKR